MTGGAFILAVSNRKGGTGKTTSAVNLAAELAARGARTLLIDLDTQGHAGLGVGLERPAPPAATVHAVLADPERPLRPAIRATALPRLSLIPADLTFDGARHQEALVLARHLQDEAIVADFDVIVVDTPPSLDLLLLNGLAAAQGVLVPLSPHPLGLHGVQQLIRLFYRIGSGVNPELRLVGLLPVMLDRRVRLHGTILDEATRQFGADKLLRGIRSDIRLAEAFAVHQPIRDYAPKSRGALDYHLLTEELAVQWRLGGLTQAEAPDEDHHDRG
jgi:chromosome partitioning protein